MNHSNRLLWTWLLLLGATSVAFFGESALGGSALILAVAWFKLDRIVSVFMEFDQAPLLLSRAVRGALLGLMLLFALVLL